MSEDWFWEGNIVTSVVALLTAEGWLIEKVADTASREAGVDIIAKFGNRTRLVEVKGYPSTVFMRGANKGMPKPTNPATQARHWYSEVLFTAILRQSQYPDAEIAIALPNFPVFMKLVRRTQHALDKLNIDVYQVGEREIVKLPATAVVS